MRKMGDILLDLEVILDELVDSQDLQFGDILNLVYGHLVIHRPDAREEYTAGGHPEFRYAPRMNKKAMKKKLYNLIKTWENSKIEPKIADQVLDLIDKEST
jgi:hypothetical protein